LRDHAGFSVANNFVMSNGGYPASVTFDDTFSEWGGKVSLDYTVSDDTLLYGYLARGFKMGTVNSNPTTASYSSLLNKAVQPEVLLTYELGFKSQFLNNTFRLNGAFFRNEWQDYQFYHVYNPGNPANLFASLVNLPEAQSYGADFEMKWLLGNQLTLNAGLGWLRTKVVDATLDTQGIPDNLQEDFQNQVIKGNELTNAPKLVYNLSLLKSFYFEASELDLFLQYHFTDKHIHILAGNNSDVWQANFSEKPTELLMLNSSLFFGASRQFKLSLWVKNALDEKYCSERSAIPGTDTETVRLCVQGEPKTVGLTFNYQFD